MKKKMCAMLLAVVLAAGLLPGTALAAGSDLPDWYFLFAIFTSVDADVDDGNGVITHTTYSMGQSEIDLVINHASWFLSYMNQVGVMNAHAEYVVIDTPVTQLVPSNPNNGTFLGSEHAAALLKANGVDLDRYDHITCVANLRVPTGYLGIAGSPFENGTGHSFINHIYMQPPYVIPAEDIFPQSAYVHEFLHFMERWNKKWGVNFDIHAIRINHYLPDEDEGKECYTDIILNRARGVAGTGVVPAARCR